MTLADLYDGDRRTTDPAAKAAAAQVHIPHPLRGVEYADGMEPCTHGKQHGRFEPCPMAGGTP